ATRYSLFAPSLFHLLHIDANRAAAGKPDLPGGFVGDAEFQRLGLAAFDDVDCLGDHRALDATAGHAAEKIALIVDHQVRAHRPRRRTLGFDHRRQRHLAALLSPILRSLEDVLVGCQHVVSPVSMPAPRGLVGFRYGHATWANQAFGLPPSRALAESARTSSAIDSRLWIGRNSSTWGSMVRMPLALASKPEKRSSGLSQISRRQERCRRSISNASRSSGSRSRPSVISRTMAPWVRTRRAHSLLKAASEVAMRVPPDQSATLAPTAASASSGSLALIARVT